MPSEYSVVQPYYDGFGSITSFVIVLSALRYGGLMSVLLATAGILSLRLRVCRLLHMDSDCMFWHDVYAAVAAWAFGALYYYPQLRRPHLIMLSGPAFLMFMAWVTWHRGMPYHSALLHTIAHCILCIFLVTFTPCDTHHTTTHYNTPAVTPQLVVPMS